MSLLTEYEIKAMEVKAYADYFTDKNDDHDIAFARAVEAAILAKLASAELPEPVMVMHKNLPAVGVFTTAQLTAWGNTRFAQGAASQLAENPMFWVRIRSDGMYEGPIHNKQIEKVRAESGGWTPLFTLKEPK